jgi:hypothetical protein
MSRDDQHPPDLRQWLTFTPVGVTVHLDYGSRKVGGYPELRDSGEGDGGLTLGT